MVLMSCMQVSDTFRKVNQLKCYSEAVKKNKCVAYKNCIYLSRNKVFRLLYRLDSVACSQASESAVKCRARTSTLVSDHDIMFALQKHYWSNLPISATSLTKHAGTHTSMPQLQHQALVAAHHQWHRWLHFPMHMLGRNGRRNDI